LSLIKEHLFSEEHQRINHRSIMFGSIGLVRDRKDLKHERHQQHCKRSAPAIQQQHHAPDSPMSKLMIMATSSMSTLMAPTPPLFREEHYKQDNSQHHH